MALSDIINAFQEAVLEVMPDPGVGPVTPSIGATGVVAVSGTALGTFNGLLKIVSGGALGTATAKVSLNGRISYGSVFTIPAGGTYAVPCVEGPGFALSGLTLTFTGTFTANDTYTFPASAAPTFRLGEEWDGEQSMFPRVVWIPATGGIGGTEDYSGAQNQLNSPQSLRTRIALLEAHCWGIDYDRAELLMDQVINGAFFAAYGSVQFQGYAWTRSAEQVNKLGREVVLTLSVKQPVTVLSPDYVSVGPPLSEVDSPEIAS